MWKPVPLGGQVSESGEEAVAKAGPLSRERLKHGDRDQSFMTTGMGHTMAVTFLLEAKAWEQIRKA